MRVRIVCPAPRGTLYGNRITALRWAAILRKLGHRAVIATSYDGEPCDLLIALHARKSGAAVVAFHEKYPEKPIIVALTGTDVYRDIRNSAIAQKALALATRIVTLQPFAAAELAPGFRDKVEVIYQSAEKTRGVSIRPAGMFAVCVVGHLRTVKDPFRAAMAVRRLPPDSRIHVFHAGAALDARMEARAIAEQYRNLRYWWQGEQPREKVRGLIASSHLLVLSSRLEGGANVISEAIVDGTPVVASRIPGSIGLLGADYPGLYPAGDTAALRDLLLRAESDAHFYRDLRSRCAALAKQFHPSREQSAWRSLIHRAQNRER
jgi:putative glycosyltransferase (TIGR04348 family)